MASPRPWPFDDHDRPSGSVRPLSQTDLQAILAHLDNDPDQLLAGTGADRPVVAVRVRTSVGRPGGSAQDRWREMRAGWWAWRLAGGCGSGPARTPGPGGVGRWGSGAPPASWLGWSGTGGRSCTTWPLPAAGPTSTTWSSAPLGCL